MSEFDKIQTRCAKKAMLKVAPMVKQVNAKLNGLGWGVSEEVVRDAGRGLDAAVLAETDLRIARKIHRQSSARSAGQIHKLKYDIAAGAEEKEVARMSKQLAELEAQRESEIEQRQASKVAVTKGLGDLVAELGGLHDQVKMAQSAEAGPRVAMKAAEAAKVVAAETLLKAQQELADAARSRPDEVKALQEAVVATKSATAVATAAAKSATAAWEKARLASKNARAAHAEASVVQGVRRAAIVSQGAAAGVAAARAAWGAVQLEASD